MNLIERYLKAVGRYLPRRNRSDILAELRSLLLDTLESRAGSEPVEEDIVSLLKEFGPPQKVAASYTDQGQYLIGPTLYPLFRTIATIVLAAVIGAQLLAIGMSAFWFDDPVLNPWETLSGFLTSIPAALGSVVIVFAILQHYGVRPELETEPWDPRTLPQIENEEPIKRGERIFGIAAGSILLAILTFFPDKVGVYIHPGGQFFANPVISQYLGWIILALLAGIGLDIFLLWQDRWTALTRVARLVVNLISIVVLALLLHGHNLWLAERGASGFLTSIEQFASDVEANWQLFGMQAFRMAFGVALIVTAIETVVQVYRLARAALGGDSATFLLTRKG